jgi:HAMP domain-containing protein
VPVRVFTSPVGPGFASQTYRSLGELNDALSDLRLGLGIVAVGGIALAALLGRLATRHAVQPVLRLTEAAEHVAGTRDLTRRIDASGGDELARLAGSFNEMLEALDDSQRAQRQLVADASHELCTALAAGLIGFLARGESGLTAVRLHWGMRTHIIIIRALAAGLLAAGALAVAACGDDNGGGGGDANSDRQAARDAELKFAQCMREHGVDMPDPGTGGRQVLRVGPNEETTPEEFEEAQEACKKYEDELRGPELSEEEREEFREAALEHARCMRENGIENFPDPTISESGEAEINIPKSSGINPQSSEFMEAEEACKDKMPDGPSTSSVGGG